MALIAGVWTASTYTFIPGVSLIQHWPLFVLVSGGTLLVYNLARYPFHQNPARDQYQTPPYGLTHHFPIVTLLLISGAAGVVTGLCLLPLKPLWPLGIAGVLVALYYAPLFRQGPFGLRMNGILKNLIIGAVWALVTGLVPFTLSQEHVLSGAIPVGLLVERTLFIYILMLPFDLEDIDRDARDGVKTIPGKYGIRFTKTLMVILLLLLVSFQTWLYEGPIWLAHLLSTAYVGLLIFFLKRERSDLHFLGFWDGTIALQAVLALWLG